jgi:hypothetical protein
MRIVSISLALLAAACGSKAPEHAASHSTAASSNIERPRVDGAELPPNATIITITQGSVTVAQETFERSDAAFDQSLRKRFHSAVEAASSKDVVVDAPADLDARTVLASLDATPIEVDSVWARVDGTASAKPTASLAGVKLHDRSEGAARAMSDGKTIEVTLNSTGIRAIGRKGWDWREGSPKLLIPRIDGKLSVAGLDAFVGERLGKDDIINILVDLNEPTSWGDLVATLSSLNGKAGWFAAGMVTSEPITARELEKQAEAAKEFAKETAKANDAHADEKAPPDEKDDASAENEVAADDDDSLGPIGHHENYGRNGLWPSRALPRPPQFRAAQQAHASDEA